MPAPPLSYRCAIALASAVAPRENALASWGRAHRDPTRPLLLFHAASAGELRQAEPVIRRLRLRHPAWQIAVSHFSRSGRQVAAALAVDATGLAPWDTPGDTAALFDALHPSAIVVTKHDLWPQLAATAEARGIPLALIAATVRPGSGRLRWPARGLLSPAYASLTRVAAVADDDATRLFTLGVSPSRMQVLGDPRYDSVLERIAAAPPATPHPGTLVAGSTWPADEAILLSAFQRAREEIPEARLILVPHQPDPARLRQISSRARALGLPAPIRHASATDRDALVVVDQVGSLALLYPLGVIAYVGGGFGRAGLHSVLEPAAWRLPIIVGPLSVESADARRLEAAGALARLPSSRAAAVLQAWWMEWLADPDWRNAAGAEARRVVEEGVGAADRCTELVESLLGAPTTSPR
jgi:3-deoxy-D-manno-octulosonic-acid transferase